MVTESYTRKVEFEKVIVDISNRFIQMGNNIADPISYALEQIGLFTQADRAYVFEFSKDMKTVSNAYEWCRPGVQSFKEKMHDIPTSKFPWWMAQIVQCDHMMIGSVDDLPEEAQPEKMLIKSLHALSMVIIPVWSKRVLKGFIGLTDTHKTHGFNTEDMNHLQLIAGMLGHGYTHKDHDDQIEDKNRQLEKQLKELKLLEMRLVQHEKMAAIGQLAAGLAHEINNPLSFVASNFDHLIETLESMRPIYLYLHELLDSETMDARQVQALHTQLLKEWRKGKPDYLNQELPFLVDESKRGLARISDIVMNLRQFSNEQPEISGLIDLRDLVTDSIQLMGSARSDHYDIKTHFEDHAIIKGNLSDLGQAFINIMENAMDAIDVACPDQGLVDISVAQEGNRVVCRIEDNGVGIDQDQMEQIFDPFFTTKEVGQGTGLGLSIAYDSIVNKHHGEIMVEQGSQGGAAFILSFPRP